ncbi:MAG: DEAD/DEAH box helicase [Saprospiraceae bacterium]|nr:DEAD/DEAH box helicase [Saprospiraceae bacterium]MDW8230773.1 DEAD/DEAH box helicase [Saprospiraceae bacterium]
MTDFKEMGLSEALLRGIAALGFETPTTIQRQVIPVALQSDDDIVALAQTGTGKTAAFGLPLLQRIRPEDKHVQAVVLCPTRELCVQVANDLANYARFAERYKVVAVYGGASIDTQIRQIRSGAHIIVATPGRLVDLLVRQAVSLDKVSRVVLDEADEMLNMGFRDAVDLILEAAENRRSLWLFSATMPDEVRAIADTYMRKPVEIGIATRQQANTDIEHTYYICRPEHRYDALKRVVDAHPGIYGLVFCRTRAETKEIAEQMIRDGYNADALHGDLSQSDRDRVMQRFRERHLQLLVATDVAARGIDVSDISHVINYGLPDEPEVYIHRAGRTGRAGRKGVSISIITPKMEERIRLIERRARITFARKPIPTGPEVCERQLFHIIQNIREQEVQRDQIAPFLPQVFEALRDLSKEELIERFASTEFNRFLAYYRNAADINVGSHRQRGDRPTHGERAQASGSAGQQRLFINVGHMDGIQKKDLLSLLASEFRIPKHAIGKVDVKRTHTLLDVDAAFVRDVRRGLEAFDVNGRRIRVNEDNGPGSDKTPRNKDKKKKRSGKIPVALL